MAARTSGLPARPGSLRRAEAATLGDLVDIAIDIDETVIESPEDETFRVVADTCCYVYESPALDEPPSADGPPEDECDEPADE